MESKNFKNWCTGIFYILFAIVVLVFTFVPSHLGEDLAEAMDDLAKIVSCEIKYRDFYFNGFCSDTGEVLDFLNNQAMRGCLNATNNN